MLTGSGKKPRRSDPDRAMRGSEEKMEEKVVDDVVRSRHILKGTQEGREAVYVFLYCI